MSNGQFNVTWRGADIGTYTITSRDMWYTDGLWVPAAGPGAEAFEAMVKQFQLKEVTDKPEKGTRVVLRDAEDATHEIQALLLGFFENSLCLRHVYPKEAVAWLVRHVK